MGKGDIQKQLGLRLRALRLARDLKQEDLEKYGFSYRHYGKLERGSVNPTLDTLVRLTEIFEVSLSELFIFLDKNGSVSEGGQEIAVSIADILKKNDESKIRKLKVFLDEIL